MISTSVASLYRRIRAQGFVAHMAYAYALTELAWRAASDHEGDHADDDSDALVRLWAEPEIDTYDDSYLDTHDLRACDVERERKDLRARLDQEGHWILVAQWRRAPGDVWETADSVGGFIGDDWRHSGYDYDLKRAALDALDQARTDEANTLAARATYAAGSPVEIRIAE